MARPMSTEQPKGEPVCPPFAVSVMRELCGSRRYCSFSGFCNDLISMSPPDYALRSKSFAIGAGRHSCVPLKQSAKERDVLIAHRVADFLHGAMISLQQSLGRCNTQL